jgi:hypothetical protein
VRDTNRPAPDHAKKIREREIIGSTAPAALSGQPIALQENVPGVGSGKIRTGLSCGVALSVFFLVECVRALALPPLDATIAEFMRSFIDYHEAGRVILTRICRCGSHRLQMHLPLSS